MMRTRIRASTLIEVLFGLVILATLLAAVVTARGRFLRQAADAQRKSRLIEALDAQLNQWFAAETPTVPLHSTGVLNTLPGASWRTQTQRSAAAAALGGVVVHVEVVDGGGTASPISVDLLIHEMQSPSKP